MTNLAGEVVAMRRVVAVMTPDAAGGSRHPEAGASTAR